MAYGVIYCDPPWAYNNRCHHSKTKFGGGVHSHYPVMKTADIAALPVAEMAAENCALLMWATFPRLPEALEVMKAWGFAYKTVAFTWVKTNPKSGTPYFGTGFYSKSNAEIVLLGIKGRMKPAFNDVSQVIIEPHPRGPDGKIIHSRKPDETRRRIIRLFGDVPRVELFARERVEGFDAIGNQLETDPRQLA